jgi:P2 family phage contractile tail tube protein
MLPRKLKNMNIFNDAYSHLGVIGECTLPKIVHAMEDWRGGGMLGPIKIDNGIEALEFEWTLGGHDAFPIRQMGVTRHDGVLLRFMGAYQSDETGAVTAVEAVIRGRHQELDHGTQKPGEDTEQKIKTVVSYYKLISNGTELYEIDMLAGIYRVGGVDRYAQIRAALGLI